MLKRVYTCDHCGKELDEMHDYVDTSIDNLTGYVDADLCRSCLYELKDIILQYINKKNDT